MPHVVEGMSADNHKYIFTGIDPEVVERQSRDAFNKRGESSWVHYHKHGEPCSTHRHEAYGPIKAVEARTVTELNKPSV